MNELRSLHHFVETARVDSFSAAAQKLSLSNAALSKSIARLERQLGARLFVRTTRSLHLTDEGRMLLNRVGTSFDRIDEALGLVAGVKAAPAGLVKLSTTTGFGKRCVLPLLPEFLANHPSIELAISFHDSGRGLSRQACDVRINWAEQPEQDKVARLLCRLPLMLVGGADYLERRGKPRTPAQLTQHDCITMSSGRGAPSRWVFTPPDTHGASACHAVTPRGRVVVMDEVDAIADAVRAGLGVSLMTADGAAAGLRDGSLVQLLGDYDVAEEGSPAPEVYIQYARREHLPLRVSALVDFLVEHLQTTLIDTPTALMGFEAP
jgi:DNA-binding transcriptional LysR family regulator